MPRSLSSQSDNFWRLVVYKKDSQLLFLVYSRLKSKNYRARITRSAQQTSKDNLRVPHPRTDTLKNAAAYKEAVMWKSLPLDIHETRKAAKSGHSGIYLTKKQNSKVFSRKTRPIDRILLIMTHRPTSSTPVHKLIATISPAKITPTPQPSSFHFFILTCHPWYVILMYCLYCIFMGGTPYPEFVPPISSSYLHPQIAYPIETAQRQKTLAEDLLGDD